MLSTFQSPLENYTHHFFISLQGNHFHCPTHLTSPSLPKTQTLTFLLSSNLHELFPLHLSHPWTITLTFSPLKCNHFHIPTKLAFHPPPPKILTLIFPSLPRPPVPLTIQTTINHLHPALPTLANSSSLPVAHHLSPHLTRLDYCVSLAQLLPDCHCHCSLICPINSHKKESVCLSNQENGNSEMQYKLEKALFPQLVTEVTQKITSLWFSYINLNFSRIFPAFVSFYLLFFYR